MISARTKANEAFSNAIEKLCELGQWRYPNQERATGQSNGNPSDAALMDLAMRLRTLTDEIRAEIMAHETAVGQHAPAVRWDTFESEIV